MMHTVIILNSDCFSQQSVYSHPRATSLRYYPLDILLYFPYPLLHSCFRTTDVERLLGGATSVAGVFNASMTNSVLGRPSGQSPFTPVSYREDPSRHYYSSHLSPHISKFLHSKNIKKFLKIETIGILRSVYGRFIFCLCT